MEEIYYNKFQKRWDCWCGKIHLYHFRDQRDGNVLVSGINISFCKMIQFQELNVNLYEVKSINLSNVFTTTANLSIHVDFLFLSLCTVHLVCSVHFNQQHTIYIYIKFYFNDILLLSLLHVSTHLYHPQGVPKLYIAKARSLYSINISFKLSN